MPTRPVQTLLVNRLQEPSHPRAQAWRTMLIIWRTMLIIMSGLPGTGKSTLSLLLSRKLNAAYIRIDTIEATLINLGRDVGHAGYNIAFNLAKDNLNSGLSVIADSVNPVDETRELWRSVAAEANVISREVNVLCSDEQEHKRRVEARRSAYLASAEGEGKWQPPTWEAVTRRDTQPWRTNPITLDTAGQSVEESFAELCDLLDMTLP